MNLWNKMSFTCFDDFNRLENLVVCDVKHFKKKRVYFSFVVLLYQQCRDNTAGDKCEQCIPGYKMSDYGYCEPSTASNITTDCR